MLPLGSVVGGQCKGWELPSLWVNGFCRGHQRVPPFIQVTFYHKLKDPQQLKCTISQIEISDAFRYHLFEKRAPSIFLLAVIKGI